MSDSNRFKAYSVGLGNVGSYQSSGAPWITGSVNFPINGEDHIHFPAVTKAFTVINTEANAGAQLRVHFSSTSSLGTSGATSDVVLGCHYVTLNNDQNSFTFQVKCKEVFLTNPGNAIGAYQLVAELTGISTREMFALTGSGIDNFRDSTVI
tara:strand:- start:2606 stop:3061 length:456 start_codon:yes stop_codon:yes gene_type:complete